MRNPPLKLFSRDVSRFLIIAIFIIMPVNICAQDDVIDRVVAVVGTKIITLSDIRVEKTMWEVLGEPPLKNDREVLEELIEQRLIIAQLEHYPQIDPTEAELDEALSQIKDFKGLSPETVRIAIREHLRVLRFYSETFARFVSASDTEIQKYYDEVYVPGARAHGLTTVPSLSEVGQEVRRRVLMEKTAEEVRRWLEHARKTTNIEIFDFD